MYSNYPNYLGSLLMENHRFKDKINYERKSIQERQALIYKQRHKNPLNRIF